jgi:hypothetical protein
VYTGARYWQAQQQAEDEKERGNTRTRKTQYPTILSSSVCLWCLLLRLCSCSPRGGSAPSAQDSPHPPQPAPGRLAPAGRKHHTQSASVARLPCHTTCMVQQLRGLVSCFLPAGLSLMVKQGALERKEQRRRDHHGLCFLFGLRVSEAGSSTRTRRR